MEILSRLLTEASSNPERFRFHPKMIYSSFLKLIWGLIKLSKDVLAEFEVLSGLKGHPAKSAFFCAGIHRDDKLAFLEIL
jgi:hypothetical protein